MLVALAAAVVVLGGGFVTNLRRPDRDPPREPVVEAPQVSNENNTSSELSSPEKSATS